MRALYFAIPVAAALAAPIAVHAQATGATENASLMLVADGCGRGMVAGPGGQCRDAFNRFRDHRMFHRHMDRHCAMRRTPNGMVKACRL